MKTNKTKDKQLRKTQLKEVMERRRLDHDQIQLEFGPPLPQKTFHRLQIWIFTEGKNPYNTASHCDIAWAGALASEAHAQKRSTAWALVG